MDALVRRVVPVLVARRVAFKTPASVGDLVWLNSARCPRAMAGKCVTVYPGSDKEFADLAVELNAVTAGLVGPEILTDRRFGPGSVVYYRYGGFLTSNEIDDDGRCRPVLRGPDGLVVEDRRDAWFAPPAWAPSPLPNPPALRSRSRGNASAVLLNGRFLIQRAIRHTAEGGVFDGYDQLTGRRVVIKQARAHVAVDPAGRDCRARRRHEAGLLARLAGTGLVPGVVAVVEQPERLFLVCEQVPGCTLRAWVREHAGGLSVGAGLSMARALVALLEAVHRAGLVLVDVSPNNIMVDPAGGLRLVDLDHAAEAAQLMFPVGTPGYTPSEHRGAAGQVAAAYAADLFGLGGLLFLLATGADPILAEDDAAHDAADDVAAGPAGRSVPERLRVWLAHSYLDRPLAARLAPAIVHLTDARPAQRWSLDQVRRSLRTTGPRMGRPGARPRVPAAAVTLDRLVADSVDWLVTSQTRDGGLPWPSGSFGATTDRCAVQHGTAGVLAALLAAEPHTADPDRVRQAIRVAAEWIAARTGDSPPRPGLYFGRAGTAWALHSTGVLLEDDQLCAAGLDLADRITVGNGNPDVAHGTAGAGSAWLHLWQATGREHLRTRVRHASDTLVQAARYDGVRVSWPIPTGLWSSLAGQTYHGYAHGTAGIGQFLLAAGAATDEPRYTALAERAAGSLAVAAIVRDGKASWPVGPDTQVLGEADWCSGAAGIGGFLLRTWQINGDPGLLRLARAAAATVHRSRVAMNTAACHGIAGCGQFLLDLAAATGEPQYRAWATDLAGVLAARAVRRDRYLIVPDETGLGLVADYGVGVAGVLTFLLRLRHGGNAPWTARPHIEPLHNEQLHNEQLHNQPPDNVSPQDRTVSTQNSRDSYRVMEAR